MIQHLGRKPFVFSPPFTEVTYLVSGSLAFLNEQSLWIKTKKAVLVAEHRFRRNLHTSPYLYSRISHVEVGGATSFEGSYAYTSSPYKARFSTLRRRLGDYLDYSIPPEMVHTTSPSISYTTLLPIDNIGALVYYPTHFSHNGFGYRRLSAQELLYVFEVPFQLSITATTLPIIPISIIETLLAPLLESGPIVLPTASVILPPIDDDVGFTYLPLINKQLPHAWCAQASTSIGAAESDEAQVDVNLWNNRVSLVLPHVSTSSLNFLRRRLMCRLYPGFYKEFQNYLRQHYPILRGRTLHSVLNGGGGMQQTTIKGYIYS